MLSVDLCRAAFLDCITSIAFDAIKMQPLDAQAKMTLTRATHADSIVPTVWITIGSIFINSGRDKSIGELGRRYLSDVEPWLPTGRAKP